MKVIVNQISPIQIIDRQIGHENVAHDKFKMK